MAALTTIIAGLGLALGAVGTAVQINAANEQAAATRRAERLREKQMDLEAARQRRQIVRNSIRARAMALNNATGQGAQFGSGLAGGYGQIGQNTAENLQGVNQGQEIGAGIFAANRDAAGAASLAAFGGGLSSLGGSLVNNSETIGRLGSFAFGAR